MAKSATLFDRWSGSYDRPRFQAETYRPIHDAIIKRLQADEAAFGSDAEATIVDLGCGTGQFTARLAVTFPRHRIIGLDYSSGMLNKAEHRIKAEGLHAHLVQADAQRLPLSPGSADVVVCSESFHWYPDQRAALTGLHSLIRPQGRLLVASIATVTDAGQRAVRLVSSAFGQPIRALPPGKLRSRMSDAGFSVNEQRRIPRRGPVPWPVLTDATRK